MKTRTGVFALAAAAVIFGTAGVPAIAAPPAGHGPGFAMQGGMHHGGKAGAFGDPARVDALRAELAITAAQEPAWTAYTGVLRDTAASMRASHEGVDRDAVHKMSDEDRQAFMKGMRARRDQAFGTVKAAAENLLAVLDDAQKTKATQSLPGLATRGHAMKGRGGMMGGMGGHRGPHAH
jgi:hypothetical protein